MGRDERERRSPELGGFRFVGGEPAALNFRKDVLAGLARPQKALPPKYFYDAAGSRLFEKICRLREYYPTRVELALTKKNLRDIARFAGKGSALLEYGSGESLKTRLLIRALRPSVYMPVDISAPALRAAATRLARDFPRLGIVAITADFSQPLAIPAYRGSARRVVYFPGSTIGNLTHEEAHAFLKMTRGQVGARGAMLIGVDLKKDANVLHAAYNDAQGVTAAFNLNLLSRINRELGGDFSLSRFAHYAFYNPLAGRIEMHLVARDAHLVNIGSYRFSFDRGESIHTENSYKYSVPEFARLAASAGFEAAKCWTDARQWFGVFGLLAA
ncbi:MAG TPA: L-histidine N(alpha)-methyltransferase [Burkholderiales bacterium]|nr:L-histidine N(alpha)-methyltransferase [Burkholderiales bacterium]